MATFSHRDLWVRDALGKDGNTNDLWVEYWTKYWISQGVPTGNFNDMAYSWLVSLGYTTDLTDMWFQWEEVELRGAGSHSASTGPFSDGFSTGFKTTL